jgi:hypothetical protein
MNFRLAGPPAAGLSLAAALAGCGGGKPSNGIAAKPAAQIISTAERAAETARSVHLTGSMANAGQSLALDLDVINGRAEQGTISASGYTVGIIDIANAVYLKGSDAFWRHFAGAGAATAFRGKWLKAPANGAFAAFAEFTDLKDLFAKILSHQGHPSKLGTDHVAGQAVVNVQLSSPASRLSVATTGQPYPVALTAGGAGGGRIVFTRYNGAMTIAAPRTALDISRFDKGRTTTSSS